MPNHFHVLVRISKDPDSAQKVLQQWKNFLNGYAQSYNRWHGTWGRVFQQGLNRKLVLGEDALRAVTSYIHANPVKHGFTTQPWNWKYSSLNALLSDAPTQLGRETVLKWFGGKDGLRTATAEWDIREALAGFVEGD